MKGFKTFTLNVKRLDYLHHTAKRLDEHRELMNNIEKTTGFFTRPKHDLHRRIAGEQDDYLVRLYTLRMGHDVIEYAHHSHYDAKYPYLRPRPAFFAAPAYSTGEAGLPKVLRALRILPAGHILLSQLGDVLKRLNGHRALIDAVERETDFFDGEYFWCKSHAKYQDDYFRLLFQLRFGEWPETCQPAPELRPCPKVLIQKR